jgi:hypothetical protein
MLAGNGLSGSDGSIFTLLFGWTECRLKLAFASERQPCGKIERWIE